MSYMLRFLLPVLCLCFSLQSLEPITHYQVLFSAQDPLADHLVTLIDKEQKSIRAAVYCLTHQKVAHALIKAHRRGVNVEILVDPFSVKAKSPLEKLASQGIALFVWSPPVDAQKPKKKKALMHDKFCVFGNETVWTGSFNFTFDGANSNQENAVVLENKEVAEQYLREFERLKQLGVRYATYKSQSPGAK